MVASDLSKEEPCVTLGYAGLCMSVQNNCQADEVVIWVD
jgi:hypothetical protein